MHTVRIYDQNDSLIWHVKRSSGHESDAIQTVRYGVALGGFNVEVPAGNLLSGKAYTLVVEGSGYGVLRFSVNSSGYLIPLKHELSHFQSPLRFAPLLFLNEPPAGLNRSILLIQFGGLWFNSHTSCYRPDRLAYECARDSNALLASSKSGVATFRLAGRFARKCRPYGGDLCSVDDLETLG